MPIGSRTTSGTRPCPPNMKRALAAWLTSSSTAHSAKSENLQLDDRPRPHHGGADGGAHDAGLRDRRVGDALGPELLDQALVLAEHAAAAEVLADGPDGCVAPHLLGDRLARGLRVGELRHQNASRRGSPTSCTSAKARVERRERRDLGRRVRRVDLGPRGALGRGEISPGATPAVASRSRGRAIGSPFQAAVHLVLAAIAGGVGAGVAGEAIGLAQQEARSAAGSDLRRAAAAPSRRPRADRCRPPSLPDAEALGARRRALAGRHGTRARGGGKAVVLAHEQDRQLPHAGPVQPFQERPAVDGAVAEDAGDDFPALLQAHRMRRAHRDQDVGADHAVGAEHADLEVGDMHGAALAVAGAALAPEQLAHHGERVGTLGDGVAVAAVGREQDVGSRRDWRTRRPPPPPGRWRDGWRRAPASPRGP